MQLFGEVLRDRDHRDLKICETSKRQQRQSNVHDLDRTCIRHEVDVEPESGELAPGHQGPNAEPKASFDLPLEWAGRTDLEFEPVSTILLDYPIEECLQIVVAPSPVGVDIPGHSRVSGNPPEKGDPTLDRPAIIPGGNEPGDESMKCNILSESIVGCR
jgi:hypothetical protein